MDLEEDLYWESERADSRIKALRSSIIKELANSNSSPLYDKISVGEDRSLLTFNPFSNALSASLLLPKAKGNSFTEDSHKYSLYNVTNHNHNEEMKKSKKRIFKLLCKSYDFVDQNYNDIFKDDKFFILSNRGTYPFICLIDSINRYLIDKNEIDSKTDENIRFEKIEPFLKILLDYLQNEISEEEKESQLKLQGAGVENKWLRFFQYIIHKKNKDYFPNELVDWIERQNDELQEKGRKCGVEIEKYMKKSILAKLQEIFNEKWELEIGSIKRECVDRALQEDEKNHKEGIVKESCDWKDMFNINDYKTIIEKHWSKKPDNNLNPNFKTFENEFSIDTGNGFNSKAEKIKWISIFNSHRNLWAHEGTKGKRLNKTEVEFIEKLHHHFYK